MVFLVENGSGVQGANAQIPIEYVTDYLAERGRSTEGGWDALSTALRQAAVVAATDYVEKRFGARARGVKARTYDEVVATATVTFGATPGPGDTITIGGVEIDVDGVDAAAFAALLYGDDQVSALATLVRGVAVDGAVVTIEAAAYGELGNYLTIAEDTTGDVTLSGATFSGGLDGGPQRTLFPRLGLVNRDGIEIFGVPRPARDAHAEYAVRAAVANLLPDPTVHASGQAVVEVEQKVGPISERYRFVDGGALSQLLKPYPAADQLLAEFLIGAGGSYR